VALLARWRWVVQAVIFEQKQVTEAFKRSAELSEGIRWKLAGSIIGVSLFSLGLGVIASFVGTVTASILLSVAEARERCRSPLQSASCYFSDGYWCSLYIFEFLG
jgi:hypothetical protein